MPAIFHSIRSCLLSVARWLVIFLVLVNADH